MLQKDFFKNVMEANLTNETIAYASERYAKMVEKEGAKLEERVQVRESILEVLTPGEKLTAKAVGEALGISVQKASYHLTALANEGLIARFDVTPKEYSALAE